MQTHVYTHIFDHVCDYLIICIFASIIDCHGYQLQILESVLSFYSFMLMIVVILICVPMGNFNVFMLSMSC